MMSDFAEKKLTSYLLPMMATIGEITKMSAHIHI